MQTTLMDVLALRKTGGLITGDVKINGFPQNPATFMRVMGYGERRVRGFGLFCKAPLHFSRRVRLARALLMHCCSAANVCWTGPKRGTGGSPCLLAARCKAKLLD
jgi:hypothetical protein